MALAADRMLVKRADMDGHRRVLVRWVGRRPVVAHPVDRVGLLVALVLLRLLVRIDLILVLEALVLLVLQAHLHHRPRARMIPINVKVWDPTVMVGMW